MVSIDAIVPILDSQYLVNPRARPRSSRSGSNSALRDSFAERKPALLAYGRLDLDAAIAAGRFSIEQGPEGLLRRFAAWMVGF
jgi:hypothetical protein